MDQTADMGTATADLARTLDAHCTGDQWCYLYSYSNGGSHQPERSRSTTTTAGTCSGS
ncbi:MAG: hypothetical protein R3F43_29700 [bacterium]